jgi:ABC-2 type transport system ATP-binding protein
MIECRGVTKRFGEFTAVDDVSFQALPGVFALLGPNGAGKSTLLKLLTGLLRPDAGEVRIGSWNVAENPLAVKRMIGVVPEDLGLFDSLTIQEHLELCGPVYGLDLKTTRERTEPLLRTLGLVSGRRTFLDQCSHGMRKKTALAMALLHNPQVLFLDEPFEGIDPVTSRTLRDLLTTLAQRGITVFLTSHILSIVSELATKIMMIRGGRMVWSSQGEIPSKGLEEIYFDLIESPPIEDLAWLRSTPS